MQYYKADGILDTQEIDAPRIKRKTDPDASMMSSSIMKFPLRLGWAFGIGAQILLDQKSRKEDYSCNIKLNNSK